MRQFSKGDAQGAVDTWLAGVRFSQHLTEGGPLIFPLIGRAVLLPDLHALTQAAQSGLLSTAQKKQIEPVVRVMPETGFDWSEAVRMEEYGLETEMHRMAQSPNPYAYYQESWSYGTSRAGLSREKFTVPKEADLESLRRYMNGSAEALRLPPDLARERLQGLESIRKTLHPVLQGIAPSFLRTNEARTEIRAARQTLLQAVAAPETH
jgi:hypothetical protein